MSQSKQTHTHMHAECWVTGHTQGVKNPVTTLSQKDPSISIDTDQYWKIQHLTHILNTHTEDGKDELTGRGWFLSMNESSQKQLSVQIMAGCFATKTHTHTHAQTQSVKLLSITSQRLVIETVAHCTLRDPPWQFQPHNLQLVSKTKSEIWDFLFVLETLPVFGIEAKRRLLTAIYHVNLCYRGVIQIFAFTYLKAFSMLDILRYRILSNGKAPMRALCAILSTEEGP